MNSDKLGFLLVQQQASVYCDQLKEAEDEHKRQVKAITRQINELYQEQKLHEKRKKELEAKKSSLMNMKNHYIQSKQETKVKYQEQRGKKGKLKKSTKNLRRIGGCLFMVSTLQCAK